VVPAFDRDDGPPRVENAAAVPAARDAVVDDEVVDDARRRRVFVDSPVPVRSERYLSPMKKKTPAKYQRHSPVASRQAP